MDEEPTPQQLFPQEENNDNFCDSKQSPHSTTNLSLNHPSFQGDAIKSKVLEETCERQSTSVNCASKIVSSEQLENDNAENIEPTKINVNDSCKIVNTSCEKKDSNEKCSSCNCGGARNKLTFPKKPTVGKRSKALKSTLRSAKMNTVVNMPASGVMESEDSVKRTFLPEFDERQTNYEALLSTNGTSFPTELGNLQFNEDRDMEPQFVGRRNIHSIYNTSNNILHAVFNNAVGRFTRNNDLVVSSKIASHIGKFEVVDADHPFNNRFTTLDWHPRKRNLLVACSREGDVAIYSVGSENYSGLNAVARFPGIGTDGTITDLSFHPYKNYLFYTSSTCGKISLKDMTGRTNRVLLYSSWGDWYSAVDAHTSENLVICAKHKGGMDLISREGDKIMDTRLHTADISSVSFSPSDPSLFMSSSSDGTVRLWDVRKVEDLKPMQILFQINGISSDGNRILTTDVHDELRVYKGPTWKLESCINHPHRHLFTHQTPIKASWHPHRDIIMCGRNPDNKRTDYDQFRCIDMFDAASGRKIGESKDTLYDGLPCLNKVNMDGDKLAIIMGYNVTLWNVETTFDQKELGLSELKRYQRSRKKLAKTVVMRGRDDSRERGSKKRDNKKEKGASFTNTELVFGEDNEGPRETQTSRLVMTGAGPRTSNSERGAADHSRGAESSAMVEEENREGVEEIRLEEGQDASDEAVQPPAEGSRDLREHRQGFFSRLFSLNKHKDKK